VGPLLIYILYKLNLTITGGTINAIIFYVQTTNGILEYTNQSIGEGHVAMATENTARAVLSLLNINLPLPVCFYNGMTQIVKRFEPVFPCISAASCTVHYIPEPLLDMAVQQNS